MHEKYQSFLHFCVPGLTQNSQEILLGLTIVTMDFFQKKVAPKGGFFREIPWGGFEACEKARQLAPQLLLLRRSEKAGVPWWHNGQGCRLTM